MVNPLMDSYEKFLSSTAKSIKASEIRELLAVIRTKKDVISLAGGLPDPKTFPKKELAEIAYKVITEYGDYSLQYSETKGIREVREVLSSFLRKVRGIDVSPDDLLITTGSQQALDLVARALLDPGDEIIVPAPYWVSYPPMIQLAGGKAVIIPTTEDQGFKITPDQLRRQITEKTRAVVINSPSNPTGSAYSLTELEALAEVIIEHDILVISDEIYEHIIYDGFAQHSIAGVNLQMKERTIILNGVSKSYAMTGWRIGFTAAPAPLVAAMTKIQSQSTSNPTSISQKAAIEAYNGPQDFIAMVLPAFDERRRYIVKALNDIPNISCFTPTGAFYAFPRVKELLSRSFNGQPVESSLNLCTLLLDEAKIAAVPGEAFGAPGYLRLSYATSLENIKNGMERLADFVKRLG